MAIYTKTGDRGSTGTFSGKRVLKSSKLINVIGTIDELNSFLGVVKSHYHNSNHSSDIRRIEEIQANLFIINSILAGSRLRFSKTKTKKLEHDIDKWEGILPAQKNFIFYGGSQVSSLLFYARAICRRAERELVALKIQDTRYKILTYINRLSDYLFMRARKANFENKIKEKFWKR